MRQSTVHCLSRLFLAVVLAGSIAGEAAALSLKPWKDDLFGYGTVVLQAGEEQRQRELYWHGGNAKPVSRHTRRTHSYADGGAPSNR